MINIISITQMLSWHLQLWRIYSNEFSRIPFHVRLIHLLFCRHSNEQPLIFQGMCGIRTFKLGRFSFKLFNIEWNRVTAIEGLKIHWARRRTQRQVTRKLKALWQPLVISLTLKLYKVIKKQTLLITKSVWFDKSTHKSDNNICLLCSLSLSLFNFLKSSQTEKKTL